MSSLRLLARIIAVEPLDGFRLRLTFTDELVREVDLSGDLWGGRWLSRCKTPPTSAK
jgi:hypothetical protein